MSISFTLGLGSDSAAGCLNSVNLGCINAGPSMFLSWLESQLGLQYPDVSFAARVIAYRACLKQCDHPNQFYHRSFAVDPFGVAKTLLQWRDALYLAGWDGQEIVGASGRLATFGEVERLACEKVAPCEGQRVRAVLECWSHSELSLQISSLDALECYPKIWQMLLESLGAQERQLCYEFSSSTSDLGRIQRHLVNEHSNDKLILSGDGTVLVVKAPSRAISAAWLASNYTLLHGQKGGSHSGLLVEGDASELDAALNARDLPMASVSARSASRPAMQALSLALEVLWDPLDPSRLLEFLTHPVSPIPKVVRFQLAEAVAAEPGMGGEAWKLAIASAIERAAEFADSEKDAATHESSIIDAIKFWLEGDKFSPYPGAPIHVVYSRVDALFDWLNQRVAHLRAQVEPPNDLLIYYRAVAQVKELRTALQELIEQGEVVIDADSLRRLAHSVGGDGASRPDVQAQLSPELAALVTFRTPDACTASVDTLTWWAADSAHTTLRYPWSKAELNILQANDVLLSNPDQLSEQQAAAWLRPIYAARKRLIMVVHSDAETEHPVFDRLRYVVDALPEAELLPHVQGESNQLLDSFAQYQHSAMAKLPAKSRAWQLEDSVEIPGRNMESFSSLESFIYGPYMWVLRYPAKIREGKILSVSDNNALKGLLAHKAFEDYFMAFPDITNMTPARASLWVSEHLRSLLPIQGAMLLKPGRAPERERFISNVGNAIAALVRHLKDAAVVTVEMEGQFDGRFVGGELGGRVDLVARKADGRVAIVDIKWGGAPYRQAALEGSKYLQLAIYSSLFRQSCHVSPAVGYFIVDKSQMLVLDDDFFPKATIVHPINGETLQEFWVRFEYSWTERRAQLDRGMIEVNCSGTEQVDEFLLSEKALPNELVYEPFSEFGAVVGWEEGA